ncbi:hypothetical protein PUN28_012472 [Cardiocondyla obscurior]|uniref:Glutathione S-transferase n=1 Tax=Cardiocondyla obscurior TaxID=286306 RepID=A0AAW2FEF7_9HYME
MVDIRKQFGGEARDSRFPGNAEALRNFPLELATPLPFRETREKLVAKRDRAGYFMGGDLKFLDLSIYPTRSRFVFFESEKCLAMLS